MCEDTQVDGAKAATTSLSTKILAFARWKINLKQGAALKITKDKASKQLQKLYVNCREAKDGNKNHS